VDLRPTGSAAVPFMLSAADAQVTESRLMLGGREVRLLRAASLDRFVDVSLLAREEAPEPPYWMHLWPGALCLARRAAAALEIGPGARVLELGCGLGLPSLAAAGRGATVVASDWKEDPLHLLAASARLNGARVAVLQMDWRAPALRGTFDLCLGAELGYDPGTIDGLVALLAACLCPGGAAWLADSVDTFNPRLAGCLEAGGFATEVRRAREEEDGRPVWLRVIEARRVR
jgi:predicted nicotinamide N-methyase